MLSTSNIRVFVQWSEQIVFAGEDIECLITFKNIASTTLGPNGIIPGGERQRRTAPLQGPSVSAKNSTSQNTRVAPSNPGHRAAWSLSVPADTRRLPRGLGTKSTGHSDTGTGKRSHRRSVSIMSLGIGESTGDKAGSQQSAVEASRKSPRGHTRASSLQIVPRRSGISGMGPLSGNYRSCILLESTDECLSALFSQGYNPAIPPFPHFLDFRKGDLQFRLVTFGNAIYIWNTAWCSNCCAYSRYSQRDLCKKDRFSVATAKFQVSCGNDALGPAKLPGICC